MHWVGLQLVIVALTSHPHLHFLGVAILVFKVFIKVRKRAKIRNRYNQAPHLPVPGYQWESENVTIRYHKRESRGQPFPSSITKQDRNNMNDPQKKRRLGTVSKTILLEGLNRFNGAPTSPLVQMWTETLRCLVCMKYFSLINASSPRTYKSRYKK